MGKALARELLWRGDNVVITGACACAAAVATPRYLTGSLPRAPPVTQRARAPAECVCYAHAPPTSSRRATAPCNCFFAHDPRCPAPALPRQRPPLPRCPAARNQSSVDAAARDLIADTGCAPSAITAVAADVSVPADVERLAAAARAALGRVDIWVNNAGTSGSMRPLTELSPEARSPRPSPFPCLATNARPPDLRRP